MTERRANPIEYLRTKLAEREIEHELFTDAELRDINGRYVVEQKETKGAYLCELCSAYFEPDVLSEIEEHKYTDTHMDTTAMEMHRLILEAVLRNEEEEDEEDEEDTDSDDEPCVEPEVEDYIEAEKTEKQC